MVRGSNKSGEYGDGTQDVRATLRLGTSSCVSVADALLLCVVTPRWGAGATLSTPVFVPVGE